MILFDPIVGIYFLPLILSVVERMHIAKSKKVDRSRDYLNLDSDAEHQSEKSEHPK